MPPNQYVAMELQTALEALIPAVKAVTLFFALGLLLVFLALLRGGVLRLAGAVHRAGKQGEDGPDVQGYQTEPGFRPRRDPEVQTPSAGEDR